MKKILFIILIFISTSTLGQPISRSILRATQYLATDTIKSISGNGINVWNNKIKLVADPTDPQDAVNLRSLIPYVKKSDSTIVFVTPIQLSTNLSSYTTSSTFNTFKLSQGDNTVQNLSGTTVSWNVTNGVHGIITLNGNTTITLSNVVAGTSGNLTVINPATTYTLTFSGYTNKISPAVYVDVNQVKTSGAGKIDVFSWWYDGTRLFWNGTNDYQ